MNRMREKFSALIQKPVYTFAFDRFVPVTRTLYRKLLIAKQARAVVCTTPSSLKSFILKFVEAAHQPVRPPLYALALFLRRTDPLRTLVL